MRLFALALTFCTGFTGLVYEVTWHRYLSNLLGSQSQAAALILAVFLGGLSLGYVIFGAYSKGRTARALVGMTGWIEVGIGAWAVVFPLLYKVVWENIGIVDVNSNAALVWDTLICVLLIGIPTIFMGGTLPLLTQGLSKNVRDSSIFHARIYASNTGGAFLGCLCGGFIIIPALGLPLTMLYMGIVNIVAGLAFILQAPSISLDAELTSVIGRPVTAKNEAKAYHIGLARGCLVAFIAGFSSLTLQTVLIRLVGLTLGSSEYAFCIVVSVFIMMIAWGASECGREGGSRLSLWENQCIVFLGLILLYNSVPYWPYVGHVVRVLLASEWPDFYVFHLAMLCGIGAILLLPVGGMGRAMPLLFASVRDDYYGLGSYVGKLYGWNTAGCMIGALLGGFLALFYLNLDQVLILNILMILCALVLVSPWNALRIISVRFAIITLIPIAAAMLVLTLKEWPKERIAVGTFRKKSALSISFDGASMFYRKFLNNFKLLTYRDDPNTSVAVMETAGDAAELPVRSIWVNGKSDGSTRGGDLRTTRLLAHLPALFSGAKGGKAAVVGFGTGITVGSLTLYPEISSIEAIEISPAVKEFAPLFDYRNHGASRHPKVHWIVSDAYRVLTSSPDLYSIIISEPSNPWMIGVERLYSSEFYEMAKSRLEPGGVFAQWFHTYSVSLDTFRLVLNTFSKTFPQRRIFRSGGDVILLGSHVPLTFESISRLEERFSRPEVQQELQEIGVPAVEVLLTLEIAVPNELVRGSGFHTLAVPRLAFEAGRDFFFNKPVGLDEFLEQPENRPLHALYSRLGLASRYLSGKSLSDSMLQRVAKNVCDMEKLSIPSRADSESRICRSASAVLAARGVISPDSKTLEREVALLKVLLSMSNSSVGPQHAESNVQALQAIEVFSKYSSPLAEISEEALRSFVAPCLDPASKSFTVCSAKLIESLAAQGYVKGAGEILHRLKDSMTDSMSTVDIAALESAVSQARSAAGAVAKSIEGA